MTFHAIKTRHQQATEARERHAEATLQAEVAPLQAKAEAAEAAAGMTPADVARVLHYAKAGDLGNHPSPHGQLALLHHRLREARDFKADKAATTKLRAKLGMSPR